jgi:alpha-glucosidase
VTDNHDTSRSVTLYGGGQRGIDRSLAVTTLMFALGGVPFLWEGQELGLDDGIIASTELEDPVATRNPGTKGRDGTRTVMPWDDSHANGFTTASLPWLHAHDRPSHQTVKTQRDDPTAPIHRYRELLKVRKARPDFWEADLEWLPTDSDTSRALRRGRVVVVSNLGDATATAELPPGPWHVVFCSRDGVEIEPAEGTIDVPDETSLILEIR